MPETHPAQVCRHRTIARLIAAWGRKEGSDVLCSVEVVPDYGGQSVIPLFKLRQQQVLAAAFCCWHACDQYSSGAAAGSPYIPGGSALKQLAALLLSLYALFDKGQAGTVTMLSAPLMFYVMFLNSVSLALTHCIAKYAVQTEVKWMHRCCHNCRCQSLLRKHVALC